MDAALRVMSLFSGTLAILVIWLGPTHADYEPTPLHELIGGTEFIVLGTISKVREHSFVVEDFDVVFGPASDGLLEVKRFVDWIGNSRWTGYRVGQTVLLFLFEPAGNVVDESDHWRIRGAGGEGEMPVEKGFIYSHGLFLKEFNQQKFRVQQGTLHGYRFELDTFLSAIEGYKRCFRFEGAPSGKRPLTILRVCDNDVLESYRRESALHRYLVDVSPEEIPPGG